MKLLIASDIHGSNYYCEKLIKKFIDSHSDKLLLLGDILYHGPRNDLPKDYNPKKVIALLNPIAKKIICIRGNCDAEVDNMVLDFDILADHTYLVCDNTTFYLAHGHHEPDKLQNGTIYLSGHTHIPLVEKLDNSILHINPGSTSIPKGNFESSFAIYDGQTITIYDFDDKIINRVEL